MIKLENTEVFGWEAAIRGMRNPKNSWNKMDSDFENNILGENDKNLSLTLAKAGPVHGKFLRMIHVQVDITAPLYYFKELDTYKVGTTTNSTSTMHKIHAKEFTLDDFSHEHLIPDGIDALKNTIKLLNDARDIYNNFDEYMQNGELVPELTDKKVVWWQLIQLLPTSYNQKRTWDANYETLANIYEYRRNHKLDEWHVFCDWIESLPHSELITCRINNDEKQ